ncbi:MAG: SpoIIE family protein phosphatase [Desulfobacterales bacterium]|nr:MAG: SpoIIE family protein phosphatase [Desulfobacterales bacterium]
MPLIKPISLARRLLLANVMLVMYFLGLTASIGIAVVIGHYSIFSEDHLLHRTLMQYAPYYDIPVSIIEIIIIIFYERPIRRLIKNLYLREKSTPAEILRARRRLLNEPFVLMTVNLFAWLGAAVFYYLLARGLILQPELATELIVKSLLTAVISVLATFFSLQYCIQRWMAPVLFPQGGLSRIRGALRIRLSTRLAALIAAVCLAPLIIIGLTLYGAERQRLYGSHPDAVLDQLSSTLTVELILFFLTAAALTYLVAVNLSRPFRDILAVLKQIKNGRFNRRVQVVSNDEIGYTGDAINEMAKGLQERDRMQRSLSLAREVQQSLLPSKAPQIPGLEIAGRSLYCDETGGDYFDFLELERSGCRKLAAIIGDVSGHGVSAALLMTSLRALLRARTALSGGPQEIVAYLNQQISLDTDETCQFVTLFYLEVDLQSRALEWVRAGHEPAYLYRPQADLFETLDGQGVALGIEPESRYDTNRASAYPGEILTLTTDGIFETRRRRKMFGRQRFMEVIRRNHHLAAADIRDAVLDAVDDFRAQTPQEDDVTLVVIKFV